MTAPDRDAEARQEIAAALPRGWLSDDDRRRIAAAVWPVVERIRERARAEGAARVARRMETLAAELDKRYDNALGRDYAFRIRAALAEDQRPGSEEGT
jgi:hypothetical protein